MSVVDVMSQPSCHAGRAAGGRSTYSPSTSSSSWENLDLDTFALPLRSDASRHSDLRSNSTPSTSGFLNHNVKFPLKDTKNLKGTATQISVGGGFSCALVEASEGNTFLYKDGSKITINPTKYVTLT